MYPCTCPRSPHPTQLPRLQPPHALCFILIPQDTRKVSLDVERILVVGVQRKQVTFQIYHAKKIVENIVHESARDSKVPVVVQPSQSATMPPQEKVKPKTVEPHNSLDDRVFTHIMPRKARGSALRLWLCNRPRDASHHPRLSLAGGSITSHHPRLSLPRCQGCFHASMLPCLIAPSLTSRPPVPAPATAAREAKRWPGFVRYAIG